MITHLSHGITGAGDVGVTYRRSITSAEMKNRNPIEINPFMVKNAAFTRLKS